MPDVSVSRNTASSSNDDYRRSARRLRARFGNDRRRLYRSLHALGNGPVAEKASAPSPGPAARFANLVIRSIDGPVIRYTQRLDLLRQAGRLGIERFEANLIIAAVQHQLKRGEPIGEEHHRSVGSGWFANIVLFALIQSVIVAVLCAIFSA